MSKSLTVTPDGEVHGQDIFWLMDSRGIPLELIADCLQKHGLCFDVGQLVTAALDSGNYSYTTIKTKVLQAYAWLVVDQDKQGAFSMRLDSVSKQLDW